MSGYYGRRSSRRHKNNSDGGFAGITLLGAIAYSYDIGLDRTLEYAVVTGLIVLGVILLKMVVSQLWRRRKGRSYVDVSAMTGLQYERYVAAWLKEQGYTHVRLTERYDLGVDIIAHKDGIIWGVQVKRCNGIVKANAVREVVTSLKYYKCDRAMVVTNGVYSRPATVLAQCNSCIMIDRLNNRL